VLILLQGICLGAGLWIHDRILVSAAHWIERGPKQTATAAAEPGLRVKPGSNLPANAETRRLFEAMPVASLIAFGWTFGLQLAIAWFLLARVHGEHARRQSKSEERSLLHTQDLLRTRDAVIFGLAKLAESRDPETGQHLERISLYSTRLAAALANHPKYRKVITPTFVRLVGISSALHDIGKVAVEDSVLRKPGALDAPERFRMQLHAQVGAESIREIERRLGASNFLEMAREIANSHHERWDGAGYPDGLRGEQIPLAARIVAIADVYDALSVRRAYKDAIPHRECAAIIQDEAGRQFDPDIVAAFLEIEDQFEEIGRRFADDSSRRREMARPERRPASGESRTTSEEQALLASLSEIKETSQALETAASGSGVLQ
jgi:HD-GYP domain-containing protein (c-di-GMP phosphodiesterase class II)